MILHKIKRDSKTNRITKGGTVRNTTDLDEDGKNEPKKKKKDGFFGKIAKPFSNLFSSEKEKAEKEKEKRLKEEEEKHLAHPAAMLQ